MAPEIATARDRARARRRRSRLTTVVVLAALALVAVYLVRADPSRGSRGAIPVAPATVVPTVTAVDIDKPVVAEAPAVAAVVERGAGTFALATTPGPTLGSTGRLLLFHVAVENGIGIPPDEFATAVDAILGDPRSWIAGDVRFQRVPAGTAASFTIYLATPVTSEAMCREEWLETEQYTSCRLSTGKVVINSARWLTAVPNYGASLDTYRAYAINHEVGHQLGNGHETCPGPGRPAPVMQQQTLGLQGCGANPWPYLNGTRYRGPAGI